MSFFGWFKSAPQAPRGPSPSPRDAASGDPKAAAGRAGESATDTAARRKSERARLRELLYKVVRESMVRVGVLSSSFKFKVLATDPRGRKFIVMMDLSRDFGSEISQLAEIETLICQTAKARHNIVVSSVYWRAEDLAEGHQPANAPNGAKYRATLPAAAAAATAPVAAPATPTAGATDEAPHHSESASHRPAFEPVLADEINALKKALAAGAVPAESPSRAALADRHPQKLTGYETTEIIESELPDTEIAETEMLDDEPPYPALSPTQYGELR